MVWLVANFLADLSRGSWRRRQQVREEVTRNLTTSRGSYEKLVPEEFGLDTVEENSGVFSIIRMRQLPLAGACGR